MAVKTDIGFLAERLAMVHSLILGEEYCVIVMLVDAIPRGLCE